LLFLGILGLLGASALVFLYGDAAHWFDVPACLRNRPTVE